MTEEELRATSDWRVEGDNFVCWVQVRNWNREIVDAAPLLRRFVGWPLNNLRRWGAVRKLERQ